MNTPAPAASRLGFAALNFDCADPAALAEFWGAVLGRPVSPGALEGDMAVEATDPASGPRFVFHPDPRPETVTNLVRPILITDYYDEEIERVTGLGAKLLEENRLPTVRIADLADPAGNGFYLVSWKSE
jgi:predicted enzyme related to lactoylglutathione lyase